MNFDIKNIFNKGNKVFFIFSLDDLWTIQYCSDNIKSILSVDKEELLSQSFLNLFTEKDKPTVDLSLKKFIKSEIEFIEFKNQFITSGEQIYSNICIYKEDFDTEKKLICILDNITDEYIEKKKLISNNERLELVLEGTRLGMWDWNPQTNEVHFDERWAEMLGYNISEIENTLETWQTRVHPDDLAPCFEDLKAHMDGITPFYENTHRMKHKNGEWVYILDRGKIVERDNQGNPIRFTGTHTNITKEKLAEQKALEAVSAKRFFLANMSHEIRTPIHGILGLVSILQQENLSDENKDILNTILNSGQSLLTILNDILDLTKLEEGKLQFNKVNFDINSFLKETISLFNERFITKNLELVQNFNHSYIQYLFTDKHRLRQVISNLLGNSIKFTDRGKITLTTSITRINTKDVKFELSIEDTGIGISKENLSKIFERFSQENETISTNFGGTGLGLSISKKIIQHLGGEITVKSEKGKGSIFSFYIICEEGNQEVTKKKSNFQIPANLQILVADDNPVNLLVIIKLTEKLGLKIDTAENGKIALEKSKQKKYDLIFLDIHMPKMNGFKALEEMKKFHGKDCPIAISLTADAFDETKIMSFEKGFSDFLPKPFSILELQNIISKYVL